MNLAGMLALASILAALPIALSTVIPARLETAVVQNQPVNQDVSEDFLYPNAQLATPGNQILIMESVDNPDAITKWYKDKLDKLDLKITTAIQTNTNGHLLNKLVGSNGDKQVEIEISKTNKDSKTIIIIKNV